jgi:cell division protease FtsH
MLRSMFGSEPGIGKDGNQKKGRWSISSQQNRITFNDVAGIDKARRELEEIVDFLKNPSRYESIGARIPKVNSIDYESKSLILMR